MRTSHAANPSGTAVFGEPEAKHETPGIAAHSIDRRVWMKPKLKGSWVIRSWKALSFSKSRSLHPQDPSFVYGERLIHERQQSKYKARLKIGRLTVLALLRLRLAPSSRLCSASPTHANLERVSAFGRW